MKTNTMKEFRSFFVLFGPRWSLGQITYLLMILNEEKVKKCHKRILYLNSKF